MVAFRKTRRWVVWSTTVVLGLSGCGKEEDTHGTDMRKPPPLPKSDAHKQPGMTPAPPAAGKGDPANGKAASPTAPKAPAVDVQVATPLQKTMPITVDYTGQTIGSETVEIRARVEGFLESIHFTEGTFLKKGDLLYEIDKEKMLQVVEQAQGELNVAKADHERAVADVARNRPLVDKNAIAREEYDTSVSAEKAAKARVDAAAAAVARAKIQLGYATVVAPAPGLVGKTEVDVGNLVGRGEATLLTTISKIDPIYAEVRISETDMLHYQRERAEGRRRQDELPLSLYFSDGTKHPHPGKIAVIDRNIDTKTGTLLVQVSFPNPEQVVRPGQFARVQAVKEVAKDALMVPQGAVEELQGAYRLYLLGEGDVVRVKTVKMGPRVGALWIVSEGLAPNSRVVVEGRQKLRDGVTVKPTSVTINEDGSLKPVAGPPGIPLGGGAPPEGGR
jgi:membrane fusion protein (multidrug efflux system)